MPGFSLTVAAGSATFPGGSKTGCINVTPVNMDKVPMVPGFGQQPRFVVTIQPVGTMFNPPAAITIPNVDGLKPRAVTEMYSYDHDLASFVSIGKGIVSDDGMLVRSDAGVGVLKAGWHCGGDPVQTGTVAICPECQKCEGPNCVPNNDSTPGQNSPNDCKREVCRAGSVVSINDDNESETDSAGNVSRTCCNGRLIDPTKECCDTGALSNARDAKSSIDLARSTSSGGGCTCPMPKGKGCCNGVEYDLQKQGCCGGWETPGRVYDKDKACCVYDPKLGHNVVLKNEPIGKDWLLDSCPNRAQVPNKPISPSNGCSNPWFAQAIQYPVGALIPGIPTFWGADNPAGYPDTSFSNRANLACDIHDDCYQTCGQGNLEAARKSCDDSFLANMLLTCSQAATEKAREACTFWANRYYQAVQAFGSPTYTSSQTEYCTCCK